MKGTSQDVDGESDDDRARRWWDYYCDRNDSAVKDIFCGQLRSEIKCRDCGYRSTSFDPFWDLSVPIPSTHRGAVERVGADAGSRSRKPPKKPLALKITPKMKMKEKVVIVNTNYIKHFFSFKLV